MRVKDSIAAPKDLWLKTPFANLIRYVPSGIYFSRIRVRGKLIRRSLKTNKLAIAKLRLTADEFLAQVTAHKAAKLKEKHVRPKPFVPGPFVRTYVLNRNLKFTPRIKAPVSRKLEAAP